MRAGKGNKDRVTTFRAKLTEPLQAHLKKVKAIHDRDLEEGFGEVYFPFALARQRPNAGTEWRWQYVFPANHRAVDPRSEEGGIRRHHLDQSAINKSIKMAVNLAWIKKRISAHTFRHYAESRIMPSIFL